MNKSADTRLSVHRSSAYSANARSFSIFPPKTPVSVAWDPLVRRLLAFRIFGMDVLDDSGRLYITPGLAPSEGQSNTAEGLLQ
jgi:hypothetical protein